MALSEWLIEVVQTQQLRGEAHTVSLQTTSSSPALVREEEGGSFSPYVDDAKRNMLSGSKTFPNFTCFPL